MGVSNEDVRNLIRLFDQSTWQEMHVEVAGLKLAVSKTGAATGFAAPTRLEPPPVVVAKLVAVPLDTWATIKAPNLGTFWRRPQPGAPLFIKIGDTVEPVTTVCLLEVMKLFTQVKAGIKSRIARAMAQDGDMVEYEAPLFVIEPA